VSGLSDQRGVDSEFVETWDHEERPVRPLRTAEIVAPKPLAETRSRWLRIREAVQEELCFCPELADDFAAFRKTFTMRGKSDPLFSTLLWGTAGMIARSQYLKKPYLGHPSRGRVMA